MPAVEPSGAAPQLALLLQRADTCPCPVASHGEGTEGNHLQKDDGQNNANHRLQASCGALNRHVHPLRVREDRDVRVWLVAQSPTPPPPTGAPIRGPFLHV